MGRGNNNKGKGGNNNRDAAEFYCNKGKNYRRDREIQGTVDRELKDGKPGRNPFEWHNAFPEFTNYAGTIPFGLPLGNAMDLNSATSTGVTGWKITQPGVMAIHFVPTIGYSADRNSPINRSAIRWMTYLRNAQKASADYDSQDMMMAFVALDSCYMLHATLKKVIGLANLSYPLNRYTPEVLLNTLGFDADEVRNNIEDYWGLVNKMAIDLGSVTMPAEIDMRKRHEWMCSGIYLDGDNVRAQMYNFVPMGFWKYNNTVTTGSQLDWVPFLETRSAGEDTTHPNNITVMRNMVTSMLSAVFGDEDIGTISGDMLNALGPSGVVKLAEIPRDYRITPSFSESVLSQIENLIPVGQFATGYTPVITQNPSVNQGAILFTPKFQYAVTKYNPVNYHKFILNFHNKTQPSVEDVIEATRLSVVFDGKYADDGSYTPTAFGSEVVTHVQIWSTNPNGYTPAIRGSVVSAHHIVPYGAVLLNDLKFIAQIAAFDWHPIIYLICNDGTQAAPQLTFAGAICDYETSTVVDPEQLKNMHEASLTSLFNLPQMGFTNK